MATEQPNDKELSELIAASQREADIQPTYDGQLSDHAPVLRQPWLVLIAWSLFAIVASTTYLIPLPSQDELGIRSVETRVSVAMYHVAHRVETYRRHTGHLPDFLEPEWRESANIAYQRDGDRYEIIGREGNFSLVYNEGDNAEELLHHTFLKLDRQQ